MDGYGRRQGGGVRYAMPFYEDGSTYSHGDPVYQYVAQNYTPEQWNSLPPDTRHVIIQNAQTITSPVANPGVHPMQALQNEAWAWGNEKRAGRVGGFARPQLDDALSGMSQYAASPVAQQLTGLYGSGAPLDIQYTHPVAQMSAAPPEEPGLNSFRQLLRHLLHNGFSGGN